MAAFEIQTDPNVYDETMLASIRKVEATRPGRIGKELRRMSAEEKEDVLRRFHPDYREDGFRCWKWDPIKGKTN